MPNSSLSFQAIARALAAAGLCAGLASPACAETETQRLQALERRLESSAQLIEKLSLRLAELERNARPQASSAPAAETTQAIAALQQSVAQLAEGTGAKGTCRCMASPMSARAGRRRMIRHHCAASTPAPWTCT